jgi:hypothetical protein
MSRAVLVLQNIASREKAARWCMTAPSLTRVEFKETKRSVPQNDMMWSLLTCVASQLEWHGQKYSADDWKDYFMHALKRARWMPSEDGGMVPIGMRTSELGVSEMADLLTLILAFGATHAVTFHDERELEDA